MAGPGLWADLAVVLGAAAGVCSAGFPPFLRRPTSMPGDQKEIPEDHLKRAWWRDGWATTMSSESDRDASVHLYDFCPWVCLCV